MKKVIIPLAPGFEELEAIAVVDILRRAGVEVTVAGTLEGEGPIEGRNNIKVMPDKTLDNVKGTDYDMVVLPGGAKGTENLKKDPRVKAIVEAIDRKGGYTTAICAAPTVLSAIGITRGRRVTSHPTVRGELREEEKILDERVVVDGTIVTSQGPGTALEFAFKLVELLEGPDKAREVNAGVLARL